MFSYGASVQILLYFFQSPVEIKLSRIVNNNLWILGEHETANLQMMWKRFRGRKQQKVTWCSWAELISHAQMASKLRYSQSCSDIFRSAYFPNLSRFPAPRTNIFWYCLKAPVCFPWAAHWRQWPLNKLFLFRSMLCPAWKCERGWLNEIDCSCDKWEPNMNELHILPLPLTTSTCTRTPHSPHVYALLPNPRRILICWVAWFKTLRSGHPHQVGECFDNIWLNDVLCLNRPFTFLLYMTIKLTFTLELVSLVWKGWNTACIANVSSQPWAQDLWQDILINWMQGMLLGLSLKKSTHPTKDVLARKEGYELMPSPGSPWFDPD